MKIIEPSVQIIGTINGENMLKNIELAARNCYKSEDKIKDGSAARLITACIKRGHESILEHEKISVRIICDRGVMAELTRHRIGVAFSIESTRYCRYDGGDMVFIRPCFWKEGSAEMSAWEIAMSKAEEEYNRLIELGAKPEEARDVLPLSLKTEIFMTANLREWRHIFKLRSAKAAHPQIKEVMNKLLSLFKEQVPIIFDDINNK